MTSVKEQPLFELLPTLATSRSHARCGVLHLGRADVETPVFMPVGTAGSVKAVQQGDLESMDYRIILCNTYHLWMRPGPETVRALGGLHNFIGWGRGILTDSGGYQVFSLKGLTKVTDNGVTFSSHLDGSRHTLTPEKAVEIQTDFGADIIMCLDECIAYPAEEAMVRLARERTSQWAIRSYQAWNSSQSENLQGNLQNGSLLGKRSNRCTSLKSQLFGIIQGGTVEKERLRSLEEIGEIGFPGLAIGGLSVGEPRELMHGMLEVLAPHLPPQKPRYLMGVGEPEDILKAVDCGVDMFDCVLPTRLGRHGSLYTPGGRINITRKEFARDDRPVWPDCDCLLCRRFSRGYLRHLLKAREVLGLTLGSLHNLRFFSRFMGEIREAIASDTFTDYAADFLAQYKKPVR